MANDDPSEPRPMFGKKFYAAHPIRQHYPITVAQTGPIDQDGDRCFWVREADELGPLGLAATAHAHGERIVERLDYTGNVHPVMANDDFGPDELASSRSPFDGSNITSWGTDATATPLADLLTLMRRMRDEGIGEPI